MLSLNGKSTSPKADEAGARTLSDGPDFPPFFLPDAGFELVNGAPFIPAVQGDCTFERRRQTSSLTTGVERPLSFNVFSRTLTGKGLAPFA
jgi:hypothetical protein